MSKVNSHPVQDSGLVGRTVFFHHHIRLDRGRNTRQEDVEGSPTQSHTSPSILWYRKRNTAKVLGIGALWSRNDIVVYRETFLARNVAFEILTYDPVWVREASAYTTGVPRP